MVQLDVIITQVLTGLYLIIGICIGWHLKASRTSPSIDLRSNFVTGREARLITAQEELAHQLDCLIKVQHELRLARDSSKSLECIRLLLEQIIHSVQQSHQAVVQVSSRIDATDPAIHQPVIDAADLAAEKWFPIAAEQMSFSGQEHRAVRRFPFPHIQRVAPTVIDEMPDDRLFFEARFRDISTTGFSFYVPEEFASERLVAKLGTGPDVVTVLAEVVHQRETWHAGSWVFHVGCCILRRLSPRTLPEQRVGSTGPPCDQDLVAVF